MSAILSQVVVFKIDAELYGIEILKVQEIVSYMPPSPIPNAPDYLKGVINLRGLIIPVIDLRTRFHFPKAADVSATVIVVVAIEDKRYGLVVDSVSDVLTIDSENVQEDLDLHATIDSRYILGIAKSNEQMIILVDIDRIFKRDELETVSSHVRAV